MQKMSFESVDLLLERNANLGLKNKIGQTALDVFGNKEVQEQIDFLTKLIKQCKVSAVSIELLERKIKEIEMQRAAMLLRQKWIDAQHNVLIDKERLKAFHKKISEKTKETNEVLLTLPEKLDNSVDKILNYTDGSEMDLSNMSDDDKDTMPFAEYENFLYDVPIDMFYNVR